MKEKGLLIKVSRVVWKGVKFLPWVVWKIIKFLGWVVWEIIGPLLPLLLAFGIVLGVWFLLFKAAAKYVHEHDPCRHLPLNRPTLSAVAISADNLRDANFNYYLVVWRKETSNWDEYYVQQIEGGNINPYIQSISKEHQIVEVWGLSDGLSELEICCYTSNIQEHKFEKLEPTGSLLGGRRNRSLAWYWGKDGWETGECCGCQ